MIDIDKIAKGAFKGFKKEEPLFFPILSCFKVLNAIAKDNRITVINDECIKCSCKNNKKRQ